ncbi:MAG: protein-disulfide reductase DsbD family protein [Amaricoccus sp.]
MQPLAALALAVALAAGSQAQAQTVAATPDATAEVRLLDGWRQADGSRVAAVSIALAPGWHTYWRVPGEAGIPPQFDWSGSRNIDGVSYRWPRPSLFDTGGIRTIGYEGTVTLPVVLRPADPDQPIDLDLQLTFGVCDEICSQEAVELAVRLPAQAPRSAAAPADLAQIDAALADRPRTAREAGVEQVTCALDPGADGLEITTTVTFSDRPASDQMAVIESSSDRSWIGPPDSETVGRSVIARAPVMPTPTRTASAGGGGGGGMLLDRRDIRVTLLDPHRAVDIRGCEAPG